MQRQRKETTFKRGVPKRLLSILLAVLIAAALVPLQGLVSAYAVETESQTMGLEPAPWLKLSGNEIGALGTSPLSPLPLNMAYANVSSSYTVSSTAAQRGETATVAVNLQNGLDNGFVMASLQLIYDKDNLTLQTVTKGTMLNNIGGEFGFNSQIDKGDINYAFDYEYPITTSGEILVLEFSINEDALIADYPINIVKSAADPCWFYDADWEESGVVPSVIAGKITVIDGSGGGDGGTGTVHSGSWLRRHSNSCCQWSIYRRT